jgi:serine/threonine protein kinase
MSGIKDFTANTIDTTDDTEVAGITEEMKNASVKSPTSETKSRPGFRNFFSSPRPGSRSGFKTPTIFIPTENIPTENIPTKKSPTEEDFINFYFKDKDTNENIKRIYDKYIVQKSFQKNWEDNNIVKEYEKFEKFKGNKDNKNIEDNKKGNIKKYKSPGWQYTFKDMDFDKLQYSYIVDEQLVTRVKHNDVYRIIKEFVFNESQIATLFMITLEITMQKMAYELLKDDPNLKDKVIVPKIINHYKVELDDEKNYKIIIEMEYIEHKILEKEKVNEAMNALEHLRNHNIFHFDTHTDNIVQTEEGKIVILDFGKAQITQNPDISSTTGLFKVHENKKDQIKFDYEKWIKRTMQEDDQTIRADVDFYGGKKTKSKQKTRKGKKKGKSKKTKKRTYRKRK